MNTISRINYIYFIFQSSTSLRIIIVSGISILSQVHSSVFGQKRMMPYSTEQFTPGVGLSVKYRETSLLDVTAHCADYLNIKTKKS